MNVWVRQAPKQEETPEEEPTGAPPRPLRWLWLIAFLAYVLHTRVFAGWIVDDAGISFAYARHLAEGHGLVSQPGVPPVEGYSNPLWVFLLAPFCLAGLFHPIVTPKILSLILVAAAFYLLDDSLRRMTGDGGGRGGVSLFALLLLAANTPFVIWTSSGLENPLYALLFVLLLWIGVRERQALRGTGSPGDRPWPLLAGLTVAGIALTRPEGIVYTVLYPLLTLTATGWRPSRMSLRAIAGRILVYTLALAVPFGAHFLFRVAYFGDVVPNTYYAKGEMSSGDLLDTLALSSERLDKLSELARGLTGSHSGRILVWLILLVVAGMTVRSLVRRRFRWELGALLLFTALPAFVYLLLPKDWMAELRLATPVFPFFYAFAVLLLVGERDPRRSRGETSLDLLVSVFLLLAVFDDFRERSVSFANNPTVPFPDVAYYFGDRYNRYAEELGVEDGSILLPDLGGALWASDLRVYDLAGLCDRTVAKTRGRDQQAFHDYILGEARPTFLRTYLGWSALSRLEDDPRFQRDYVPLVAFYEPEVKAMTGRDYASGEFIRREVAERSPENPAILARIRQELRDDWLRELALRLGRPVPPGPGLKPGGSGPIPPPEEAERILKQAGQ